MNPQQFSSYLSQNYEVHGASSSAQPQYILHSVDQNPIPPRVQPTTRDSGKQRATSAPVNVKLKGVVKKNTSTKLDSTPLSIVKKQLEDHDPDLSSLKTQIDILQVQVKNLQRVADTSMRRINNNDVREEKLLQGIYEQYNVLKQGMTQHNSEVRTAIETLAKYSLQARHDLKVHDRVVEDFKSLVDNYTNGTLEKYLDDRCLQKFNEMADKILHETEMSPEEISEIAKSLGLDVSEESESENPPSENPPSENHLSENELYWNFDEVITLLSAGD